MTNTRRNRFVVVGVLGLAVVALIIGLSAGLTQNKANNSTTDSAATSSTTMSKDSTSTGTASTSTTTGSPTTSGESESKSFTTSTGTMEVTLMLFNPNITIPYSDDNALKADLTEAAKLLVINLIKYNNEQQQYDPYGYNSNNNFGIGEGENGDPINTQTDTADEGIPADTDGTNEIPVLRYVSREPQIKMYYYDEPLCDVCI